MWFEFRPYVPVAQRRAQAAKEMARRQKKGQTVSPVVLEGRTIARTFWGKAWCDNLESYSDFANRLPRGRTYVRNGSVVDLQIQPGKIKATVSGSELYEIAITITPMAARDWSSIKSRCVGQVGSLVELLKGKLSDNVIEIVTAHGDGLFPRPGEIHMSCSCPDGAYMCKHLAAVLYGVGARLDQQPELLFHLRKVDHRELIEEAASRAGEKPAAKKQPARGKKTLAATEVAGVFGIEIAPPEAGEATPATPEPTVKRRRGKAAKPEPVAETDPPAPKPAGKGRHSPKAGKGKKGEAGA
jgi:uncharacterized Zn finger protein